MSLRWLHISDVHLRPAGVYEHEVALRALLQTVTSMGSVDLVFVTGDIVSKGDERGFEAAGQ